MRFFMERFARMTKGGIAGLIAVVVLAGVVLFFWTTRAIRTTPSQCATCHPVLTAMWQRSQGHPADRVTCYECHAPHAQLPASAHLASYVRDRIIPETYLSAEKLIQQRCRGCHPEIPTAGTGARMVVVKDSLRSALARVGGFEGGHGETLELTVVGDAWGLGERELETAEFLGAAVKSLQEWEVRRALARAKAEDRSEAQAAAALVAVVDAAAEKSAQAKTELARLANEEENEKVAQKYLDAARVLDHAAEQHRASAGLVKDIARGLAGDAAEVRVVGTALGPRPSEMPKQPEGDEPGRVVEPADVLQSSVKAVEQVEELTSSLGRIIKKRGLTATQQLLGELTAAGAEASRGLGEVLRAYEELETELASVQQVRQFLHRAHLVIPAAEAEDGRGIALTVAVGRQGEAAANQTLRLKAFLEALLEPLGVIEQGMEKNKVIRVNHKAHVSSQTDLSGNPLAMGCLDCHRNVAHDKAQIETYRPRMAGCFVGECHRKDRNKDNCRRCHYQDLTEPDDKSQVSSLNKY